MYKKDTANYRKTSRSSNKCKNCKNFIRPDMCRQVLGDISPNGWCKFYKVN